MIIDYKSILLKTLDSSKKNDFYGYSKFDALNSPLLELISGENKFLRGGFIYLVSRMPINIRPLLFVKKYQNPKGLALFARSYFSLYKMTGDRIHYLSALALIDILLKISQKEHFSGHCWGYDHPWQNTAFFAKRYFPNTVVTVFVCEALIDAFEATKDKKYIKIVKSVCEFIFSDLKTIIKNDKQICSSYIPGDNLRVINVNAIIGSLLARVYKSTDEKKYKSKSKKYIDWVVSTQTGYGAWYYTDPPHNSPITHDNYHTGFVLDSIEDYCRNTGDDKYQEHYNSGLVYYKKNLFTRDYAPKWMFDKIYPHDIHGVAQGIITFSKACRYSESYIDLAKNIANWGINNLYDNNGNFFYQQGKFLKKRYTLMRWCQAWMCFALSNLIVEINKKY